MENDLLLKVENSIQKLKEKSCKIFFLVQDTKGNAKASIRQTYEICKSLNDNGFNSIIIYESNDYVGVKDWMGEDYANLPHESIENQNLKISPEDFIVIPEVFGHVLEQIANMSCGKIISCQAYDNMMETLQPGMSWSDYGFLKCITTSEEQKTQIESVMKNVTFDIIEPYISPIFSEKKKPSKPIVSIHTREQRDTMKIIKTFYLKYPQYRWVTFRDMRGLNQEEFSEYLQDSFVSVWVDDVSGFGTYPIESMMCGTPVIGKIPNLKPGWMTDNNGIWVDSFNSIVDVLAEFLQNWLEDNINEDLYEIIVNDSRKFSDFETFSTNTKNIFEKFINFRLQTFEEQYKRLKEENE